MKKLLTICAMSAVVLVGIAQARQQGAAHGLVFSYSGPVAGDVRFVAGTSVGSAGVTLTATTTIVVHAPAMVTETSAPPISW